MGKTLESLIDGSNMMAPVEVRGYGSVGDETFHSVQDDPADTVWEE
jgi:hypothetical protein